jgi:hypothetical protein
MRSNCTPEPSSISATQGRRTGCAIGTRSPERAVPIAAIYRYAPKGPPICVDIAVIVVAGIVAVVAASARRGCPGTPLRSARARMTSTIAARGKGARLGNQVGDLAIGHRPFAERSEDLVDALVVAGGPAAGRP